MLFYYLFHVFTLLILLLGRIAVLHRCVL